MKLRISSGLMGLAVAAAVAVTVLSGSALAQTPTPPPAATPSAPAQPNYREFYLNDLASKLGVTRQALDPALTQARNDTVDQMVKDGRLTQDQANRIKSRPAAGPFGGYHHGMGDDYDSNHGTGDGNMGGRYPSGTPGPSPTSTP